MKRSITLVLFIGITVLSFNACKKAGNTSEDETSPKEKISENAIILRQLGVNFNISITPDDINGFKEIDKTKTVWVRANLKFFDLYKKYLDGLDWQNDSNLIGYKSISGHYTDGHYLRAAVNIKFDFESYPTLAGSSIPANNTTTYSNYMSFLTLLLQEIMPYTDLIVSGNEPFISCLEADKTSQRLVNFYMGSAHRIRTWENNNNRTDIPIYLGSFDDADRLERQTNPAYLSLLDSVKNKNWITGADLHLHNKGGSHITNALNFVLSKIGSTKKFMSTEFSLFNLWGEHMEDQLTSAFTSLRPQPARVDYDGDGKKEVWEYIKDALLYPRSRAEWNDWNRETPFLFDNRKYICSTYNTFTSSPYNSQFQMAFYGIGVPKPSQGQNFGVNSPPWLLNSLFIHDAIVPDANGDAQTRYFYFNDFVNLRNGTPTSCD